MKVEPLEDDILDALAETVEAMVEKEKALRREDQTMLAIYLLQTIVRLRRSEGKAADLLHAAEAAHVYLKRADAFEADAITGALGAAVAAEKDRRAKRMWKTPALRTLTKSEVEEHGRQLGIDQCIATIRAGVAARRTRPEYGERFVKELEALKKHSLDAQVEAVLGFVASAKGIPREFLGFPPSELTDFGRAEAMRLADEEARLVNQKWDDLKARGCSRIVTEVGAGGHLYARPWRADLDPAVPLKCSNCGLPEDVHADAGGSSGLAGCQKFRVEG